MDASQVAVATITWPRSTDEEVLLGRSLRSLGEAGLPVAVTDRGTSAAFSHAVSQLPGFRVTIRTQPGLVAQVKDSIALAATFDTSFILYAEPDKESFFKNRLRDFLHRAPDAEDVGVVVASRSNESFKTFPSMQRCTEAIANYLCGLRLGYPGDFLYGPFLMTRNLLAHVARLEDRVGWGWRLSTFVAAHRAGLRVISVTDDYPCPLGQRTENDADRLHRVRQLNENILGLVA
jgi:hypothetical protein